LVIISGILIIVILWILTNLIYQSQIENRLLAIIHGFDELAHGNFNTKIQVSGRHELAALAAKFNETVGKLKTAHKNEEQAYHERLERADRLVTLGEVAAEIAHEVNNPAGNILIRTEFLKEELNSLPADSPILQNLSIISQQTQKIAEITRSILHYARKLPRSFTTTDLNGIIRHSVEILTPRIKKQRTKIELYLPVQPAIVWGNSSQLEQVFCNLINNSLDVLPETTGQIELRIMDCTDEAGSAIYRITCQDNGPGIPTEHRSQIFSPFFTTKAAGEGTGLGLFIAKNIVGHHNGKIYLQEEPGPGTCFVIELAKYING